MNVYEIPNLFQLKDTIYHYCDLNTAVEYILHDKRIRLSARKKSTDPIENLKPFISHSTSSTSWETDIENVHSRKEIETLLKNKIKKTKQACFCMNNFEERKFNSNPQFPHEYFGFLKPRMWEQYADKYRGVCLAFSLEALKKEAAFTLNDEVKYSSYNTLELKHYSIDDNRIEQIGIDRYWTEYSPKIGKAMLHKHYDYRGENEYRFLSFSENEYDYIDIADCIKGIIVSETYTSDFMKNTLNNYAKSYNIELLNIQWDATWINITTKTERDK